MAKNLELSVSFIAGGVYEGAVRLCDRAPLCIAVSGQKYRGRKKVTGLRWRRLPVGKFLKSRLALEAYSVFVFYFWLGVSVHVPRLLSDSWVLLPSPRWRVGFPTMVDAFRWSRDVK